ncbi:MAG: peptidoglycan -binding protein [Alphaproteobacteria bacterium]
MASPARRSRRTVDIWPGFVDALTSLLLVITFMLVVFVLSQFYLRETLSGRDEALTRLSRQVSELADLLALERQANANLRLNISELSSQLQSSLAARDTAEQQLRETAAKAEASQSDLVKARTELESVLRDIEALKTVRAQLEAEVGRLNTALKESEAKASGMEAELGQVRDRSKELEAKLAEETERTNLAQKDIQQKDVLLKSSEASLSQEQKLTTEQHAQIEILNQQIAALRQQLAAIEKALEVSETQVKEQNVQIADLGKRLNVALAGKVQELARYRSEFFGKLREILGDRPDIRVVGDRFVFQSEVLFDTGSAEIGPDGKQELAKLAQTLLEIAKSIPKELNWVLRVDGHTDKRPINNPEFPSNWELSTARAISVVRFLVSQGVAPERLAATGFGEFQPLEPGDDEIAYRRNRRIELKLSER